MDDEIGLWLAAAGLGHRDAMAPPSSSSASSSAASSSAPRAQLAATSRQKHGVGMSASSSFSSTSSGARFGHLTALMQAMRRKRRFGAEDEAVAAARASGAAADGADEGQGRGDAFGEAEVLARARGASAPGHRPGLDKRQRKPA